MKINNQHLMNDFLHMRPVEKETGKLQEVENLLCALGWKAIDDYNSMFCANDLEPSDEVVKCFAALEWNIVQDEDGASMMKILRKILGQHRIDFEMRHKRNGNYLILVPPDHTLQNYLTQKSMMKKMQPVHNVKIMPDFNIHTYLTGLNNSVDVLADGTQTLERVGVTPLVVNPKLEYTRVYDCSDTIDEVVVCHETGTIYVPLKRGCDAAYGFNVLLYYKHKDNLYVLGKWTDPEIQVGNYGSNYKCTGMDSALTYICASTVACWAKLPLTEEAKRLLDSGHQILTKVHYTGIYLSAEQRITITENDRRNAFYNIVTLDTFGCGARKTIVQPNGHRIIAHGQLSEISVEGHHVLELKVGGHKIPITYEYDRSRRLTVIKDFTADKPILAKYLIFNELLLYSRINVPILKVMYSDIKPEEWVEPTVDKAIEVQYDSYALVYAQGICGINKLKTSKC